MKRHCFFTVQTIDKHVSLRYNVCNTLRKEAQKHDDMYCEHEYLCFHAAFRYLSAFLCFLRSELF